MTTDVVGGDELYKMFVIVAINGEAVYSDNGSKLEQRVISSQQPE